ncbi:glycosyltransferase [Candidatus Sumerlaeota bacterium]|nr:glycosyltransferase [Candidatus Sumerlaeota bacterium]MBI3736478.1 glycosyltransferase [Candidatus Sumerlaeota bacterium]
MTEKPVQAIIFTDINCRAYPQPAYLCRALAERLGDCLLVDDEGCYRFSARNNPQLAPLAGAPSRMRYARSHVRFLREIVRHRPPIIIGVNETMIPALQWASRIAPRRARCGLYFLDYWEDMKTGMTWRLRRGHAILQGNMKWVDFVVDCEGERLARRAWVDASGAKAFVLHNVPPRHAFPPLEKHEREGSPRIIYAGRVHQHVCLREFFRALSLVRAPLEARLYLRGTDSQIANLTRLRDELGLMDRVEIFPELGKEALFGEYRHADIGLCFYRHGETVNLNDVLCSPNKVFEYLASGLAVLASSNPTLRFIENEGVGCCVDPSDPARIAEAIDGLLRDRRFAAMGTRARELFDRRLSYEKEVEPILTHLQGLTYS